MQVHGPSEITDHVDARMNPGSHGAFAVLQIGGVEVYLYTPAEADKLAAAVAKAKRLLTEAAGSEH